MPKLRNVTAAEIADIVGRAEDMLQEMADFSHRISQGYKDPLQEPAQTARTFSILARNASDMAIQVLASAAMEETKRATERLLRERADLQKAGSR